MDAQAVTLTPIEINRSRAIGVDVSHYQPLVEWDKLFAQGVSFAIIKASQGVALLDDSFLKNSAGAKASGMVTGAYHWHDPTYKMSAQVSLFMRATKNSGVSFLCVDVEQWWGDWDKWFLWRKGTGPKPPVLSPTLISESARSFAYEVYRASGLPTLLYSRNSFVASYAVGIKNWSSNYDTWVAQYPYNSKPLFTLDSFNVFRAIHIPNQLDPILLPGNDTWRFWQITGDKFSIPGVWQYKGKLSNLDINLYHGSRQELYDWAGVPFVPEPETAAVPTAPDPLLLPEDGEECIIGTVAVDQLNVRVGPGVNCQIVGKLKKDDKVKISKVTGSNLWGLVGKDQWVAIRTNSTYTDLEPGGRAEVQ